MSKTVTVTTDEETLEEVKKVLKSLIEGPLKNPKLSFSKAYKASIEDFLADCKVN